MEDNQQDKDNTWQEDELDETNNHLEAPEEEIWDEAIKTYNNTLFSLLRYA